ncbi:hypothetical protein [Gloeobacter kilaueensis]|nr:hypothetical protein [Gloeobacter kilaueensis]
MRGNLIFAAVLLVFLFALVLVSSRAFLPADMKAPARMDAPAAGSGP